MNGFFKLTDDGIQRANAVYAPGYSLTADDKSQTADGWKWFESAEDAVAFFAGRTQVTGSPIEQGEIFVENAGLSASRLVTLMDLLMQTKEAGRLDSRPKLVALYEWLQTVKNTAIAGNTTFPAAPYSFEEVISE